MQKSILITESPPSSPPSLPSPSQFGFEESKRRKKSRKARDPFKLNLQEVEEEREERSRRGVGGGGGGGNLSSLLQVGVVLYHLSVVLMSAGE